MSENQPDDEFDKQVEDLLAKGGRIYGANTTLAIEKGLDPRTNEALQPFYTCVAKIATQWGIFEMLLDETLWKLVDVEPSYGACVTSQIGSTYLKLKAITALLPIWPETEPLISKLNQINGGMEKIVRKRNRATHDPLAYDPKKDRVLVYRSIADKNEDFGWGVADLQEYKKTITEISKLSQAYAILKDEILAHVASRGRPQSRRLQRLPHNTP